MRILITGGAGFVGSALARRFKADHPDAEVVALDNLKRRGSELNVALHLERGIKFAHGDIRCRADLFDLEGGFDLMIEASAEPSVLAGQTGSPDYLLSTNLMGTLNCLEFARQRAGAMIFLSTSRVYSIAPLREIPLKEGVTRFERTDGICGVAEDFPVNSARSLYGASKLASELVIQEYAATYGFKAVINRCGVIAGPGQFGKVDQGVFTLWVANHFFGKPLQYTGFGGTGKQVRDLLHPDDLYELLKKQLAVSASWNGDVYNAGGGADVSTSLLELTALCREATGRQVTIGSDPRTNPVDIPYYITDNMRAAARFDWRPRRSVRDIVLDIAQWIRTNEPQVAKLFQ